MGPKSNCQNDTYFFLNVKIGKLKVDGMQKCNDFSRSKILAEHQSCNLSRTVKNFINHDTEMSCKT